MKYLIIVAFISLILAGCSKDDTQILSAQDVKAIEGMEIWLNQAVAYNDSLRMCCEEILHCDETQHRYYDDRFHHSDSMYHHHHDNFSHTGIRCDHSHNSNGSMRSHHNGNMHSGSGPVHKKEHYNKMQRMMYEHCFDH